MEKCCSNYWFLLQRVFMVVLLSGQMLFVGSKDAHAQIDSALLDSIVSYWTPEGFVYFKPGVVQPGELFTAYKEYFVKDTVNDLILKKSFQDNIMGMDHYRYQQYYKGFPVEAAEFTEHARNGFLVFANGKVVYDMDEKLTESILSKDAALQKLLATLPGSNLYAWQDESWEKDLQLDLGDSTATYYPEGEMLWALTRFDQLGFNIPDSIYRLAWRFDVLCLDPDFHQAFYVDAYSGALFREDELRRDNGPANIPNHGIQVIDTEWKGGLTGAFILKTNDAGRNVHTKYYPGAFVSWGWVENIKDGDDIWMNSNQLGTTPHWMVSQAWDYFSGAPYNRVGMDLVGSEVRILANAQNEPNAYYDPTRNKDYLVFGVRPNGNQFAVIDIAGHEYTHGITHYTAGLMSRNEPGALGESFSDIFGFMVQRFTEGGITSWLYGEYSTADTMEMRSMINPNNAYFHYVDSSCTKAFGQPDTYEGDFWYEGNCDYGGVHVNCSVQNFWFYLLSEGGSGTNDNGDAYNITGIGPDNAALITYLSLTTVLQQGATYADARQGAISIAEQAFGICSPEAIATTDAWAAVGVGAPSPCNIAESKPKQKNQHNGIRAYPNPASDYVFLTFDKPQECVINLYDINGMLMQRTTVTQQPSLTLDISGYVNGFYMLEVTNHTGIQRKKILKVK